MGAPSATAAPPNNAGGAEGGDNGAVAESIKRLKITKETFNNSKYFKTKYGKLKYVSESGRYYKTTKGKVLQFVK